MSKRDFIPASIFLLLAILSAAVIGYLKADALRNWLYTSDLFSFDTVLQEALRGHWGLEFTYGNAFGDHAYLFLLLLVPIKFLLSAKMVYLLVLLGPFCYLVSSILFFLSAKQIVPAWKAFPVSIIFLLGFTQTYHGLFEQIYGMHPDTFAGFLAVSMAALLIWKEHNDANNKNSLPQTIGSVFFTLMFLSLKEEMAILAFLFFVVVFLIKRTAFHRNMVLLSGLICAIDFVVMKLSNTPFNRTNEALISTFIQSIQTSGIGYFFTNPHGDLGQLGAFWSAIGLSCLLFTAAVAFSERINPYTLGLFLIGLVKLFFGAAVADYDLASWHNFSGFILILAAVLYQCLFTKKAKNVYVMPVLILLTLVSSYSFLAYEVPFVEYQLAINTAQKRETSVYFKELSQIMKQVDPQQVVSIPIYTVKKWVGYRYSFYPRGISNSPVGIADFAVYPINGAEYLAHGYQKALPLKELSKSFSIVTQTPHFILLKRTSSSEDEIASRKNFFSLFK